MLFDQRCECRAVYLVNFHLVARRPCAQEAGKRLVDAGEVVPVRQYDQLLGKRLVLWTDVRREVNIPHVVDRRAHSLRSGVPLVSSDVAALHQPQKELPAAVDILPDRDDVHAVLPGTLLRPEDDFMPHRREEQRKERVQFPLFFHEAEEILQQETKAACRHCAAASVRSRVSAPPAGSASSDDGSSIEWRVWIISVTWGVPLP